MQGVNAYTNTPDTTPQVDNRELSNQNLEASRTDLNTENTNAAQKAFEVSITKEAQDKMAAQAAEDLLQTQTTTPEDQQTAQDIVPAHENSQIVNIVA